MNTQKLFEIDSHMIEFDATVLSCEKIGKNYAIVLDLSLIHISSEYGGYQKTQ